MRVESDKDLIKDVIPAIIDEVEEFPLSFPTSTNEKEQESTAVSEPVVHSATKRESDSIAFEKNISNYLESIIALRDRYANRLYALLVFEVLVMFSLIFLSGLKYLALEQWLVVIVVETILVKTFLTIQIIVKNLFPNKNLFELLVQEKESK